MQGLASLTLLLLKLRILCVRLQGALRLIGRMGLTTFRDPTCFLAESFRRNGLELGREGPSEESVAERDGAPPCGRLLVIIPFRDGWSLTQACLESLKAQNLTGVCRELSIVLLDNGSQQEATRAGLERVQSEMERETFEGSQRAVPLRLCVQRMDIPFNFSKLCNAGVRLFEGKDEDWVLFLNNDVELTDSSHLGKCFAVPRLIRSGPPVGALGCTLLFPDNRIQHTFLAPGVKIVGAHPLAGMRYSKGDEWFQSLWQVPAVTGAFLLTPRAVFEQVGGFDEKLAFGNQDLDYCLKLQQQNLKIFTVPQAVAYHYEGATRGRSFHREETELMYDRWSGFPAFSPGFLWISTWKIGPPSPSSDTAAMLARRLGSGVRHQGAV